MTEKSITNQPKINQQSMTKSTKNTQNNNRSIKIDQKSSKLGPWGILEGFGGHLDAKRRRLGKLRNPTWRQVGSKIRQNSFKNVIKKSIDF